MPWLEKDLMNIKKEFVEFALTPGANRRELCRRFGISPKTAYTLLARYSSEGEAGLQPRSKRPVSSPKRTCSEMEQIVIELRQTNPCWGGRKLARRLEDLGYSDVPSPSTISAILMRHELLDPQAVERAQHWQRFEHEQPNSLWQIDFKGYFQTPEGRCYPMTLLDDHSRFNLALQACKQQDTATVQEHLIEVFRRYGLPVRINSDNGGPWGSPSGQRATLSALGVWLVRQGIRLSHSAPYHPQTNGKIERFHRSLKAEVLNGRSFENMVQAQQSFERWRQVYNHERPHEALNMQTPIKRYHCSNTPYSETLPAILYDTEDIVLTVGWNGWVKHDGVRFKVSSALHQHPIALRADSTGADAYEVYFCHHRLMHLDMNSPASSN